MPTRTLNTIENLYTSCIQCPRKCKANRLEGQTGFCKETGELKLAFAGLHFGEEPPVTVFGGSGTIFFTGCTLRCAFCQNYQISQDGYGKSVSKDEFVQICLKLQKAGAENINLVTGSHHIPLIAEYLRAAREKGVSVPFCWNSSAYESVEMLELLKGLVTIWLPDLKTLSSAFAGKLFAAPDYPETAAAAIRWMIENNPLKIESIPEPPDAKPAEWAEPGQPRDKLMQGVIIRHLFMPGHFEETADVLQWLKENADEHAIISLMNQYTPVPFKEADAQLTARKKALSNIENRLVNAQENEDLLDLIEAYDFEYLFYQELTDDTSWLPDFTRAQPFSNKLATQVWHCYKKIEIIRFSWYNNFIMAEKSFKKLTGVAVPLGALYTKENPSIGEFPDLIPFAQFCKKAGLSIIQLLPVNDTGTQSSPYSGLSAFALHPVYIRLKDIEGFSKAYENDKAFKAAYDDFTKTAAYSPRYDYDYILNTKITLLKMLYDLTPTGQTGEPEASLSTWIKENSWVKTYAVYKNLKWKYMQASWKSWQDDDKEITQEQITKLWAAKKLKKDHLFYAWCQMVADEQFSRAVKQVHKLGLLLKGDIPILMNEDSCNTWANPEVFNQKLRAGSPSDFDNPAGQNWGFPTYNWKNLKNDNYSWWKNRLKTASAYYDAYRLDHILGFFRIWAIPSCDCNALNGHTEPYACFKAVDLYELGFDEDRIRWLSKPHIPTKAIEDITWNHETAHKVLELFCNRINEEELWLFDKSIEGSRQLVDDFSADDDYSATDRFTRLNELVDKEAAEKIKQVLVKYWSDRTLLEVARNKYIPLWTYGQSTSWASLNDNEKNALTELFASLDKKNLKLWQKQADEIFTAITKSVKMIPCGEDLGVSIKCVPETMEAHNILGLRVIRWCREWNEEGQPYIPFKDYTPLSVATTSVHDSSTLRQWWEEEKESVKAFAEANSEAFGIENDAKELAQQAFTPEFAQNILKASATCASQWFIPPLQDFLYLEKSFWLEKAEDERINIPGTVTKFNWTYRMPCTIEALNDDETLIERIRSICRNRLSDQAR